MTGRPTKKRKVTRRAKPAAVASPEARRRVAAVLEVLAGAMSPTAAAEVLGCSQQRYYGIESQALAGMLAGCEPRTAGRVRTPERELAALEKEYAKLERECARYKALSRAAQRTAGLSASKVKQATSRKGKRKRKPTVRALKLSQRLKDETAQAQAEPAVGKGGSNGSRQKA